MASNQSSVGLTSLQKWFKVWVALSVGSFLGSSVVPPFLKKSAEPHGVKPLNMAGMLCTDSGARRF